ACGRPARSPRPRRGPAPPCAASAPRARRSRPASGTRGRTCSSTRRGPPAARRVPPPTRPRDAPVARDPLPWRGFAPRARTGGDRRPRGRKPRTSSGNGSAKHPCANLRYASATSAGWMPPHGRLASPTGRQRVDGSVRPAYQGKVTDDAASVGYGQPTITVVVDITRTLRPPAAGESGGVTPHSDNVEHPGRTRRHARCGSGREGASMEPADLTHHDCVALIGDRARHVTAAISVDGGAPVP